MVGAGSRRLALDRLGTPDIDRGLAHLLAEPPLGAVLSEKPAKLGLEHGNAVAEEMRGRAGQREHAGNDVVDAADDTLAVPAG